MIAKERHELKRAIKGLKLLKKVVKRGDVEHYQNDWGVHLAKHKPEKDNYCGTMCCAAGKFALSKEGRKLGVTHEWVRDEVWDPIKEKDRRGWSLEIGGSQLLSAISDHIGNAIGVPERYLYEIFNSTTDDEALGKKGISVVMERIDDAIRELKVKLQLVERGA